MGVSGQRTKLTEPDGGVLTYTYDATGNLTEEWFGATRTIYIYDNENRLVTVVEGTNRSTFTYNDDGVAHRETTCH